VKGFERTFKKVSLLTINKQIAENMDSMSLSLESTLALRKLKELESQEDALDMYLAQNADPAIVKRYLQMKEKINKQQHELFMDLLTMLAKIERINHESNNLWEPYKEVRRNGKQRRLFEFSREAG